MFVNSCTLQTGRKASSVRRTPTWLASEEHELLPAFEEHAFLSALVEDALSPAPVAHAPSPDGAPSAFAPHPRGHSRGRQRASTFMF